ncbi:MAG: cobalamin-binding protein [Chloroflexi bacterium]|nr:cobalamin-binding protein [Chloroflexota bacterium]
MLHITIRRVSLVVALGLALSACGAPATPAASTPAAPPVAPATPTLPPAPTVEAVDGAGQTIRLAGPAQRIVSLAPSNTEILFAIDAGGQMVGRDEFSDYPEAAKELPSIATGMGKLNTEAVVALEPDVILAAEITAPDQVETLRGLGLTVFVVTNPKDFEGLYSNIQVLGTLCGRDAEAKGLADELRDRVTAVGQKLSAATSSPRVFYELDGTDPTKPWTSGPGTFLDLLIRAAGGTNVGAVLSSQFAKISSEELVRQDPQVILLGDTAYGTTVEGVSARAGWGTMTAIKQKSVHPFDDNLVSRPGPRMVDGLEQLARLIHPELFAQ